MSFTNTSSSDEETDVIIFNTIKDAIDHNMKLVMIRPEHVKVAREFIDSKEGNVLVGTVIDFPNGNSSVSEKVDEATKAIEDGVDELDYVIDYQAFKNGNIEKVQITFNSLDKPSIKKIVKLELDNLKSRLLEKNYIFNFGPSIIKHIVDIGYDEKFGARPLQRAIQTEIEVSVNIKSNFNLWNSSW